MTKDKPIAKSLERSQMHSEPMIGFILPYNHPITMGYTEYKSLRTTGNSGIQEMME